MSGRPPRRLSRSDRALLDAWIAQLAEVEVPADLGGEGLDMGETIAALARVAIHRTAVEADPALAGILVAALRVSDAECARLLGVDEDEVHPDDTELAGVQWHLAVLLATARDGGHWQRWRADVLRWVRQRLAPEPRGLAAVRAVVTVLDETAGAEPADLAAVLDARDVPALLWLLGGLVALAGRGDVAWLDRLERRDAR